MTLVFRPVLGGIVCGVFLKRFICSFLNLKNPSGSCLIQCTQRVHNLLASVHPQGQYPGANPIPDC